MATTTQGGILAHSTTVGTTYAGLGTTMVETFVFAAGESDEAIAEAISQRGFRPEGGVFHAHGDTYPKRVLPVRISRSVSSDLVIATLISEPLPR